MALNQTDVLPMLDETVTTAITSDALWTRATGSIDRAISRPPVASGSFRPADLGITA